MTRNIELDEYRANLRAARIQDALHGERRMPVESARNQLLEILALATSEASHEFDSINDEVLDTAVSLALTEVEENADDALSVVLTCVQVLAADGQFARLSLLADRLFGIGAALRRRRPFLGAAAHSFGLLMQGKIRQARQHLDSHLSPPGTTVDRPQKSEGQATDILICACVRETVNGETDTLLSKARSLAIRSQNGSLYEFVDALTSWRYAAREADPVQVLTQADPSFQQPQLREYLRVRDLNVLFPPQIRAIVEGATLDRDQVVALPTSSGKTLLAELRVAASLVRSPGTRAIYVAPYRLLSRQVQRAFSRGLKPLGLSVRDMGSGYDPALEETGVPSGDELPDVAVCTPERLDSLLRLATHGGAAGERARLLFETCKVLVFDELQLVGRMGRGSRFELLLTRIRSRYPSWHMLGLCAASSDTERLSQWLTSSPPISGARRPTGTLEIVWKTDGRLAQRVPGRPASLVSRIRRTNPSDDAVSLILRLDAKYRPVLAVETTRQYAEGLAKKVQAASQTTGEEWRSSLEPTQLDQVDLAAEEISNLLGDEHPLVNLVMHGIAYHHAGLPTPILRQIERLSARKLIRVVCATTTVAEGADLPFRVVVLPHMNFHGEPLSRDLYLNIIGRAGRAGVSVEGLVFILDSDARTLANVVETQLWSARVGRSIDGTLSRIPRQKVTPREWMAFYEVQSQVLSWLGEGNSYTEEQASYLASQTFSWNNPRAGDAQRVTGLLQLALEDLEARGFAVAGSPYRLTGPGALARLTGLSAPSVSRLAPAVSLASESWLPDLVFATQIEAPHARKISELLFEAVEMIEKTFWFKQSPSRDRDTIFAEMVAGQRSWPYGQPNFEADIDLIAAWISGRSYSGLADAAPTPSSSRSLFGGRDRAKRVSDVADYIGSHTYAASWIWSGVKVLAGSLGDALPSFIRDSIELGVPSEGGVKLVKDYALSRPGALLVTSLAGASWVEVRDWIRWDSVDAFSSMGLTRLDAARLERLRSSLLRND
ncbi:DEAD/DEAH box helicase [Streptomyces argyrophyllae]|uniref:DEAD/DEAH box helicase n=1 Tax=Streptomyces argyrophylli TaxID=2726118 RepID=A0A6M4PPB0_9ACTN|nr:DEAD/DEAH box helicase [Streptomyces argyrophyllae]QJS11903.1 DEAD/DEAH box helicase [Streptomyces argyrophyllae]